MTAVVKTLIPAHPVEFLLSTNIPFLDRNNPDAYSTRFREDFQPCSFKKAEPVHQPIPAQVDHKDLRHIKECLTETMVSYHHHPLPQITRTPQWTKLYTNFKMQTDPREVTFLTTQSQNFKPQHFQAPPTPFRLTEAIKKIQQVEKFPDSTSKATFTPHYGVPVVKATVKHLEEGFPTIKGDERHHSFVSQYSNTFQGAWSRAAQLEKKHSSVSMGDPVKIVERETTHAASFRQPTACSPPVVKERSKLNLGNFSKDSWSSTSKEAFCYHKLVKLRKTHLQFHPEFHQDDPNDLDCVSMCNAQFMYRDPVVLTRRNKNSSSLPRGDTDTSRNKERMSVTTNRISFSEVNHTEPPVYVSGPDLRTKSHVQFSPPCLSGLYYTTTAKEHYGKKDREQAKPAIQLPGKILSGPESGPSVSTTKTDFLPLKACKQTPCLSMKRSHIRFPLAKPYFSTTHSEHYTAKPLILQSRGCSQFFSHFDLK